MKRIVVLISGTGSNLQAIHHACQAEGWPARIVAVLSNKPDADGLDWARAQGIEAVGLDHRVHADRAAFDAALSAEIDRQQPDLVVLAGFMRILTPAFVARYEGRMINIHPSLLPAFSGLHTHQRAINAGCRVAGATVHFVTAELDHGPIVAQAVVPVLDSDDAPTLARRVLAQEHRLYPMAVRWFVFDELALDGLRVRHTGAAAQHLLADAAGSKDTT
ncbi:phosphoribosylglycinamide formyltransferase [Sphaerotilus mobilis]|uniref:Phosphoribosylglycinamide formyltransferase n=1 Tax=Sphaerotilus mobilis TaxID=47994 RepID=A0A4Q7LD93_9BURK|nr:phosphoribosylglycinamide formyltransferase [Sphaerotilus mobilis]RZS52014.1 formyltetrahydrofolate-dependent phosphoribosylglycinamide formyltransferase [Sphaerotilus mobilis]